jgi:hypothetical protein
MEELWHRGGFALFMHSGLSAMALVGFGLVFDFDIQYRSLSLFIH